jgi:tetratricopeptide (TPR) repeat protein
LAPALLLVVSSLPANAQTTSDLLNPLFQGILAQPANFNNALQYATLAPAGDIESAISTYEQLLFYNPNLASVRFELGVLYYRLGSYEMARSYFASALKMKDITPALRQRSEDLVADIDKRLQPDQFNPASATRPTPPWARWPGRRWPRASCSTTASPRGPMATGSARSA